MDLRTRLADIDARISDAARSAGRDPSALTRIVVTHSLDEKILGRYDRILTMKAGRIIESGTFEELMEKKGYFYSLYTISQ